MATSVSSVLMTSVSPRCATRPVKTARTFSFSPMLKGSISNVQLGSSGEPEWIQSGYWVLRASGESVNFVAKITMVKPDGTSMHTHTISQLSVPENSMMMEGTTDTIKGTATVLMPSGAVQGVPITIKVMNNAVVALWIGPDKVALSGISQSLSKRGPDSERYPEPRQ